MSITLTDGTTTINLSPDLFWPDEQWVPVQQSVDRSITGALIVDVAEKVGGRPITLQAEDDKSAWMSRAVVDQLRNMAAVPGKLMTLTLRGVERTVMFRHEEGNAFEATPILHYSDVMPGDWYTCTLRFMEIPE